MYRPLESVIALLPVPLPVSESADTITIFPEIGIPFSFSSFPENETVEPVVMEDFDESSVIEVPGRSGVFTVRTTELLTSVLEPPSNVAVMV